MHLHGNTVLCRHQINSIFVAEKIIPVESEQSVFTVGEHCRDYVGVMYLATPDRNLSAKIDQEIGHHRPYSKISKCTISLETSSRASSRFMGTDQTWSQVTTTRYSWIT